ncbi:hypothetical protein HK102_006302 [Quaeritorhiza haematococci]|nr:hypothetical protein HK102_006302 [Quaeritorhiza haematococci]
MKLKSNSLPSILYVIHRESPRLTKAVRQTAIAFLLSGTVLSPIGRRVVNLVLFVCLGFFYPTLYVLLWHLHHISLATTIREKLWLCASDTALPALFSFETVIDESRELGERVEKKTNVSEGVPTHKGGSYDDGERKLTINGGVQDPELQSSKVPLGEEDVEILVANPEDSYRAGAVLSEGHPQTQDLPSNNLDDSRVQINLQHVVDNKETPREHLIRRLNLAIIFALGGPTTDKSLYVVVMQCVGMCIALVLVAFVMLGARKENLGMRLSLSIAVVMFAFDTVFAVLMHFHLDDVASWQYAASLALMASLYVALLALIVGPSVAAILANDHNEKFIETRRKDMVTIGSWEELKTTSAAKVIKATDQILVGKDDPAMSSMPEEMAVAVCRVPMDEMDNATTSTRCPPTMDRAQGNLDIIHMFFDPPIVEVDGFSFPASSSSKPHSVKRTSRRRTEHRNFGWFSKHRCGQEKWKHVRSSQPLPPDVSLEKILADPGLTTALGSFLAREFGMEKILFLKAAAGYRQTAVNIMQQLCLFWEARRFGGALPGMDDFVNDETSSTTPASLMSSLDEEINAYYFKPKPFAGSINSTSASHFFEFNNGASYGHTSPSPSCAIPAIYIHHVEKFLLSRAQTVSDEYLRRGSPNEISIPVELQNRIAQVIELSETRIWSFDLSAAFQELEDRSLPDWPRMSTIATMSQDGDFRFSTSTEDAMFGDKPETGISLAQSTMNEVTAIGSPNSPTTFTPTLSADLFDDVVDFVEGTLMADILPRFKKTAMYRKALRIHFTIEQHF